MTKEKKKVLEFLRNLMNFANDTTDFKLTGREDIQIYSAEEKTGIFCLVENINKRSELSLLELFRKLKEFFLNFEFTQEFELENLYIISNNEEDELIEEYIEFLKQKNELIRGIEIEFWGWNTMQEMIKNYSFLTTGLITKDFGKLINFVPTANVYQLFGIDEILEKIDRALDSEISPVVVYNPFHGVGKTAVALAYVFHYDYQKKFDHVAYVEIVSNIRIDFISAFDGYLIDFMFNDYSLATTLEVLYETLNFIPGRNLLIIDGVYKAEHISFLKELAKQLNWKILITSRFQIFSFKNIYLDHPDKRNAKKIFEYFQEKELDEHVVDKITDLTYNHPFLLVFLAKQFSYFTQYEGFTVEQLVKLVEKSSQKNYRLNDYFDRGLTANQIALQKRIISILIGFFDAQYKYFSYTERQILTVASLLPSKLITLEELKHFVDYESEEKFADAILLLVSKGWLEADKHKIRVAPYVRVVLYKRLKPGDRRVRKYEDFIIDKLAEYDLDIKWLAFAEVLVKGIITIDLKTAELASTIADLYYDMMMPVRAEDFCRLAVIYYEKLLQHGYAVFEQLIENLQCLHDYDKAVYYVEKMIDYYKQNSKIDDHKKLEIYKLAAFVYYEAGDYYNALDFIDLVIEILDNLPYKYEEEQELYPMFVALRKHVVSRIKMLNRLQDKFSQRKDEK